MDEILSSRNAPRSARQAANAAFCARETSLPSGISTANACHVTGSAAEVQSTSTSSTYADVINYTGKGVHKPARSAPCRRRCHAGRGVDHHRRRCHAAGQRRATTGAGIVPAGRSAGPTAPTRSNVSLEQILSNVSLRIQLKRSRRGNGCGAQPAPAGIVDYPAYGIAGGRR